MSKRTLMNKYLLAIALALVAAAAAQAERMPFWGAKAPLAFETPADQLGNGDFTWAPQIAPSGPIMVLVSIEEQRAYTYRNGVLIGIASVSTGKRGHETPTGVFQTFLKDRNHHSSTYHNAAMPYTEKLTQDGIALHAGGVPGYPESHGCVHLPSEYARLLFDAAPKGMTVVITKAGSAPDEVRHPPFLDPLTARGQAAESLRLEGGEAYRWEPEKSPDGPMSILISREDERIVVLRNGVEIGRAKVVFRDAGQAVGSHVFVTKSGKRQGAPLKHEWFGVAVVGHMGDAGTVPYRKVVGGIAIAEEFKALLSPQIEPGTTLMLTDYPVLEHTTGIDMAILSSHPDA